MIELNALMPATPALPSLAAPPGAGDDAFAQLLAGLPVAADPLAGRQTPAGSGNAVPAEGPEKDEGSAEGDIWLPASIAPSGAASAAPSLMPVSFESAPAAPASQLPAANVMLVPPKPIGVNRITIQGLLRPLPLPVVSDAPVASVPSQGPRLPLPAVVTDVTTASADAHAATLPTTEHLPAEPALPNDPKLSTQRIARGGHRAGGDKLAAADGSDTNDDSTSAQPATDATLNDSLLPKLPASPSLQALPVVVSLQTTPVAVPNPTSDVPATAPARVKPSASSAAALPQFLQPAAKAVTSEATPAQQAKPADDTLADMSTDAPPPQTSHNQDRSASTPSVTLSPSNDVAAPALASRFAAPRSPAIDTAASATAARYRVGTPQPAVSPSVSVVSGATVNAPTVTAANPPSFNSSLPPDASQASATGEEAATNIPGSPVRLAPNAGTAHVNLAPAALPVAPVAGPIVRLARQVFAGALDALASERPRRSVDAVTTDPATGLIAQAKLDAVTAPTTADHAALDLKQDRGLMAMIDHIEALRDDANANDTRIRLVPDALGAVDVTVRKEGEAVHVRFTTESDAARAAIADAQPRLADLAQSRGVRIAGTSVETGAGGQGGQSRQHAPAPVVPLAPPPARGATETTPISIQRLA